MRNGKRHSIPSENLTNQANLPRIRTLSLGLLAQLVEQRTLNPSVECSSHSQPTNKIKARSAAGLFYFDQVAPKLLFVAINNRHRFPLLWGSKGYGTDSGNT